MQPQKRRDSLEEKFGADSIGGQQGTSDEGRFPPPNVIQVPNRELYITDPEGGFCLFQGLQALHDEGWKLHVPLPDGGHLCPPVVFLRRDGTKFKILAKRYDAQSEEQRASDKV